MSTIEELETQIREMSREIDRMRSITEIQNLMANYEYWHYPYMFHRKRELFALTMPDVWMDLSSGGIFTGKAAIEFLFNELLGKAKNAAGAMFIHPLTTPALQIAGDAQTARGVWISPGLETYYTEHSHRPPEQYKEDKAPMAAYWCWGKYSCDFIKENGAWKIWHMKWWRDFRCDYYKSWVDDYEALNPQAAYPQFDRTDIKPMRYHEPYNPKSQVPRRALPPMPKPYDTYDGPDWIYEGFEDQIPPMK
jgi:hypothetical protein